MNKPVAAMAVLIAGAGAFVAIERVNRLGLNSIFSREHTYLDDRPLTDAVAIELTREALKADGRNTDYMVPFERSPTSINGNGGYVLWGPLPNGDPWQFPVRIDKTDNDQFNVRAYRGK